MLAETHARSWGDSPAEALAWPTSQRGGSNSTRPRTSKDCRGSTMQPASGCRTTGADRHSIDSRRPPLFVKRKSGFACESCPWSVVRGGETGAKDDRRRASLAPRLNLVEGRSGSCGPCRRSYFPGKCLACAGTGSKPGNSFATSGLARKGRICVMGTTKVAPGTGNFNE